MRKSLRLLTVFLLAIFLSGCLVFDNTEFKLSRDDRAEAEDRAKEITFDFFSKNEYPNFDDEGLVGLLNEEKDGDILTINPIFGPRYSKNYELLKEELEEHIFAEREDADYKLKYGEEGEGSYKLEFKIGDFNFQEISRAVLPFRVNFMVYETVEDRGPILTDNGTAFFELRRHSNRWWIDDLTINFRELGAVRVSDVYEPEDD